MQRIVELKKEDRKTIPAFIWFNDIKNNKSIF